MTALEKALTPRQTEVLNYLRKAMAENRSPALKDIGNALGIKSAGNVCRLIQQLEKRGHVARSPGRWRGVCALDKANPFDQGRAEGFNAGYRAGYRAALSEHGGDAP